jgi:metallo-beta-lactamase class B
MQTKLIPPLLLVLVSVASASAQDTRTLTPQELFQRNVGSREQQERQFPPHKIIGNVYYVGTETLAAFLITTPQGHILVNSMYERTVPVIRASVEQLGFKFTDIRIVLGSHAHADHMEGDALVKQLTGAQVMAMEQDVPALQAMQPGGQAASDRPDPARWRRGDVRRHDARGQTHARHTKGCTTWTMKVQEGGRSYDVVIIGSMGVNPGIRPVNNSNNPTIAEEYTQGFKVLHSLPCDVPLGSHPAMYGMTAKHAKLGSNPNPFIDPQGYKVEVDLVERTFKAVLDEQRKGCSSAGSCQLSDSSWKRSSVEQLIADG